MNEESWRDGCGFLGYRAGESAMAADVDAGIRQAEGRERVQINISTRHGHLSAETRDKLSAKLNKLSRFHERLTSVNATVDLEHPESPQIELRVSVEHAEDFVATDQSGSLFGSLDAVTRKLEQQLRKHKEKITDRRHAGGKEQRMAEGQEPEQDRNAG